MIKRSIFKEDVTILDIYAPSNKFQNTWSKNDSITRRNKKVYKLLLEILILLCGCQNFKSTPKILNLAIHALSNS